MTKIGFIGFGEAAQAFANGWRDAGLDVDLSAFDVLFNESSSRDASFAQCAACDVKPASSAADVASHATYVVSAVTASQTIAAAHSVGQLSSEQRYLDISSVAPKKKTAAAEIVGDAYVDLAVLSPVHPQRHESPILYGGASAAADAAQIERLFPAATFYSDQVGPASLFKMIRSVFVKGLEAVTTECVLAALQSGILEDVLPTLDVAIRHNETKALADYVTERVAVHGQRRSAEMEEVCATLEDLGVPNAMSAGSVEIQKLVGDLDLAAALGSVPNDAEAIGRAVLERINSNGP